MDVVSYLLLGLLGNLLHVFFLYLGSYKMTTVELSSIVSFFAGLICSIAFVIAVTKDY